MQVLTDKRCGPAYILTNVLVKSHNVYCACRGVVHTHLTIDTLTLLRCVLPNLKRSVRHSLGADYPSKRSPVGNYPVPGYEVLP